MLTDLLTILRELRDLNVKKIAILLLSSFILIGIWKFDIVVDTLIKVDSHYKKNSKDQKPQQTLLYSRHSAVDVSPENLEKLKAYLSEYLPRFPQSTYSIAVFKFLPPGYEYSYQGRILVAFKSKQLNEEDEFKLLKELNVNWIPMWSGKASMEALVDLKDVALVYDEKDQKFKLENKPDVIPNSNLPILGELGIKTIYRYPIQSGNRAIGYLSIYLTESLSQEKLQELKRTSSYFSNRIVSYLLNTEER